MDDCLAMTGGPGPAVILALIGIGIAAVLGGFLLARRGRRTSAALVLIVAFGISLSGLAVGASQPASAAASCEDTGAGAPPASPPATPPVTPTPTPTPTSTPVSCPVSDKSEVLDADGDGIANACDLDSDNDGITDAEEDLNQNGLYEDDDVDGDLLVMGTLGDGVSTYLDLDSENDGIPDLMEGRVFTRAEIDAFDSDHDGVFDADLSFGTNGLLDDLETTPDSGILKPQFLSLRNTDGDDKFDYIDLTSNGSDFDLYAIGRSDLDVLGGGFITPLTDADADGIMDAIDTDTAVRGAPGSPYSPYSV